MSLFVCEECRTVENTALCGFWLWRTPEGSGRALCSACDPEIGKWHGRFPRNEYDPEIHNVDWLDGGWRRPGGTGALRSEAPPQNPPSGTTGVER